MLAIAASMLGLNTSGELRLERGRIERRLGGAWTDTGLGIAEIALVAYLDPLRLPAGMEPGLEAHKTYDPPPMTYSNATHLCEAVVDASTGAVTLERTSSPRCGTCTPEVSRPQHGAIAMGSAASARRDRHETPDRTCPDLRRFMLATAVEIPLIEIVSRHTPNRRTPTGSKGMSEGGVMGAIGAVMNAVNDALKPFGVVADRQPLTPEYIRSLIRRER